MKTGNVSHDGVPFTQARPISEDKRADKRGPDKSLVDRVELSTTEPSVVLTPVTSYGEALSLVKGMDFRQALDAQGISRDAATRIMGLLQA